MFRYIWDHIRHGQIQGQNVSIWWATRFLAFSYEIFPTSTKPHLDLWQNKVCLRYAWVFWGEVNKNTRLWFKFVRKSGGAYAPTKCLKKYSEFSYPHLNVLRSSRHILCTFMYYIHFSLHKKSFGPGLIHNIDLLGKSNKQPPPFSYSVIQRTS